MSGFMDCYGASDIGRKRPTNEDHFLISDVCKSVRIHQTSLGLDHQTQLFGNSQGKLLMVADGMGGHESGERASQLVLDTVVDYVLNKLDWVLQGAPQTEEYFIKQLKDSLDSCQQRIEKESANVPTNRKMGSTLTLVYVVWPRAFVIHVGDSRCYLLRDNELKQLTRDHTLAQLYQEGIKGQTSSPQLDLAQPIEHRMNHVLWNAIGGGSDRPKPDAMLIDLEIGDALLLCTDGLPNAVSTKKIHELLASRQSSSLICSQLIAEANELGGEDNITAIVSQFVQEMSNEHLIEEIAEPSRNDADTDEFKNVAIAISDDKAHSGSLWSENDGLRVDRSQVGLSVEPTP